jgi:hypothetical protein
MKYLLTAMMLTTTLVLCFDGRALWLPLAAADEEAPANAIVSFGAWQTEPPFDRFPPNNPNDRNRNDHQVLPNEALIKAGGAINFVISGFHQPIVYEVGTQPEDIDVNNTTTTTGPTPVPAVDLINDPTNRLYRGQDPSLQPLDRSGTAFLQDRVEVVRFLHPGTYLVICGIKGHFLGSETQPPMYGFVTVK